MTCPDHDQLIGCALNDGLSVAERDSVARHCAACPACSREIAALRATFGLIASRVDDLPAPDLRARVLARLADRSRPAAAPRRFWVPVLAAAGLLCALAGYHALTPAGTVPTGTRVAQVPPAAVAVVAPVAAPVDDIALADAEAAELFDDDELALWREMDAVAAGLYDDNETFADDFDEV
ncbi:MAG TPA: hypothetical protein PKM88_04215 [bacterium]|nr:hypothetical protein [bacterium]